MKQPTVIVCRVGAEREPVAVIENFAPDPDYLRSDSALRRFEGSDDYYPGVKASVSDHYLAQQWGVLAPVFRDVFGIKGKVSVLDVTYALVADPPAALMLEQRLPHVDALMPGPSCAYPLSRARRQRRDCVFPAPQHRFRNGRPRPQCYLLRQVKWRSAQLRAPSPRLPNGQHRDVRTNAVFCRTLQPRAGLSRQNAPLRRNTA